VKGTRDTAYRPATPRTLQRRLFSTLVSVEHLRTEANRGPGAGQVRWSAHPAGWPPQRTAATGKQYRDSDDCGTIRSASLISVVSRFGHCVSLLHDR